MTREFGRCREFSEDAPAGQARTGILRRPFAAPALARHQQPAGSVTLRLRRGPTEVELSVTGDAVVKFLIGLGLAGLVAAIAYGRLSGSVGSD